MRKQLWIKVMFFLIWGWLTPFSHAEEAIRIAGSTTVLPIASIAGERFQAFHPEVRILVNGGGSGVGVQGVGTGRLDIGLASRELTELEQQRFQNAGLKVHAVGKDAVACVVSSEIFHAGVRALSKEQIRDIYLGRITNWKEVGGPDRTIVVIDKERHRGTRHAFMNYVMGNTNARAPGARLVTGSNNEEQSKLAQSDSAIGMLSFAWMNEDVKGLALLSGDELIEPTLSNVRGGRYPIVRNLYLITRGTLARPVKRFLEWVQGPEGQQLVRDKGYVPFTRSEGSHIVSRVPAP